MISIHVHCNRHVVVALVHALDRMWGPGARVRVKTNEHPAWNVINRTRDHAMDLTVSRRGVCASLCVFVCLWLRMSSRHDFGRTKLARVLKRSPPIDDGKCRNREVNVYYLVHTFTQYQTALKYIYSIHKRSHILFVCACLRCYDWISGCS